MNISYTPKALLVLILAVFTMLGTATAKSLYVNADLNNGSPIQAWDIQGNTIAYQATSNITGYGGVGLAIDPDTETLFVTFEFGTYIKVVDAGTLHVPPENVYLPNATNLAGIVYDVDKQLLYAVDRHTNKLYVYTWNADTKFLTNTITEPPYYIPLLPESGVVSAYGLALDEVNDQLYVTSGTNIVHVFSTDDWSSTASITLPYRAVGIAIDTVNNYLYTGGYSNQYLTRYDLINDSIVQRIMPSGANAVGLAVDLDTSLVYATTAFTVDNIMVFDSDLTLLSQTIDIGNPTGIVVPTKQISYNPLSLAKDDGVADDVYIGDTINYQISYDNLTNTQDVTNVTLLDTLPPEVDFVSSSGTYDPTTHTVFWNLGTISAGAQTAVVSVEVVVNDTAPPGGVIFNHATIGGAEVPPVTVVDQNPAVADDEPGTKISPVITVVIDIKPNDEPNSINLGSAGVIPVAILSSSSFDATTVDPETVSLAGAAIKMAGKSGKYLAHEEDVNGDGLMDLVCQVYTAEFMIEPGETTATLEGRTYDGMPILGEDSVNIVPDN